MSQSKNNLGYDQPLGDDVTAPATTRRGFMKTAGVGVAAAGVLGAVTMNWSVAGPAMGAGATAKMGPSDQPQKREEEEYSAEEVLQELMAGNDRFVRAKSEHPRMTEEWRKRLTKGQRPLATILACSDSRVPLELVFDQGFGDLFTVRVAGNVVTRISIGSMEYAQHHLHTPLFMVLGHEGCGAVAAALLPKEERDKEPKGVRELLSHVNVGNVDPSADAKSKLATAVEANVRNSARKIMEVDPKAEGFQIRGTEMMVSAVYELSTGRVRILEKHTPDFYRLSRERN